MPAVLVAALVVVPIVEIWLLLQVGRLLGVLPTVVLLVAMSLLGAFLLRREGARTWRAFREALAGGRLPAAEVADGALVILGGALLLTPGFASDAFGLLCVLPPTRAVLRRVLTRQVARRLTVGTVLGGRGPSSRRRPSDTVVDGEVVRPPDDPGRPPGTVPPA